MAGKSQQPKGQDGVLSSLNAAIGALERAKATGVTPAEATFTSASTLLTEIKGSMISKADYVELGLTCSGVCEALGRGMAKRQADELSQSVLEAIRKFKATMDEIQRHITKRGKQNVIFRYYHARNDREATVSWRLELNRIWHVFNTEFWMNTHATVSDTHQDAANKHAVPGVHSDTSNTKITSDVHRDISITSSVVSGVRSDLASTPTVVSDIYPDRLNGREGSDGKNRATHKSAPGESPPPQQRNTRRTVSDTRRSSQTISEMYRMKRREGSDAQHPSTQNSVPGSLPPPPPRIFGRNKLIKEIVDLAVRSKPIALIGAGGIGKTSIILTVLHDYRIKQRFGDNRRFIPCDKFSASRALFLRQLSKVIGAGIDNPEDLDPLRRCLSSKGMIIVLDNAESFLDSQEIYTVVEELTRFNNICLCITSRISTIPPRCETLDIPILSTEAARDAFYRIYKHGEQSDMINGIIEELGLHPLSITLLATVAQRNTWNANRLVEEWEENRTRALHVRHSGSLATTIELSLASPIFQELGPNARELLGVVAFFPRGINEENARWLLPTISNRQNMLDKFCILSLTSRANGFVTMLAPLRDYFCPKNSAPSLLLLATMERYSSRLSTHINPDEPGFEESQWVTSEDVNIEHLLDVFTSIGPSSENVWNVCANFVGDLFWNEPQLIGPSSEDVWDACANFMGHLFWNKPRLVMLGPRIEALPDDHPSKAQCLRYLSLLFSSVGNWVECKRLLTHTLQLCRGRKDDQQVAQVLCYLSDTNRRMALLKDGIQQAEEGSEIFKRLGMTAKEAESLIFLAWALHDDEQFYAAEEAASRAIDILPKEGKQFLVCQAHRIIGSIYHSRGNTEKAIYHLEESLKIASSPNLVHQRFWVHFALARVFSEEGRFDDAEDHIKHAKSYAINDVYNLGRAMELQANVWYQQRMFKKAKSEASQAADVFEKLGAARDLERCRELLQREEMNKSIVSDESDVASTYVGSLSTSPTILSPR